MGIPQTQPRRCGCKSRLPGVTLTEPLQTQTEKHVMKYQNGKYQNGLAWVCCCAAIIVLASTPAEAARRSRTLPIVLLASGLGLQFGGNMLKASAQNRYDRYLNAAIQADIQAHRSAYLARQNGSLIMSRVGYGCIGLAVLLSIYSQLDSPDEPALPQADSVLGRLGVAPLAPFRFSTRLQPHYEWQTGRASLRLLHYF